MRARDYLLLALSLVIAGVFTRLGFWQISRMYERRAFNTVTERRFAAPPVALDKLPRDSAALRFRRARIRGTYDYARQIVVANRTRNGSPGINVLTPLRTAGSDTAVLVNRGWVYSPDALNVDLTAWREADTVNAVGYVDPFGERGGNASAGPRVRRGVYRWLDQLALAMDIPYPLAPFAVVLEADSVALPRTGAENREATSATRGAPPRIPRPTLDEGPHRSYAIQWFSFAAISIAGMALFMLHLQSRPEPR